jgi:hypothetical protein
MIEPKTGKKRTGFLRNVKIAEVSGCPRGMNPLAQVVLVKARETSRPAGTFSTSSAQEAQPMNAFAKAQSEMDAIVRKHMERYDVPEHVAHERLSRRVSDFADAPRYKAAYAAMDLSKAHAIAKGDIAPTLAQPEVRSTASFKNAAERQLDELAGRVAAERNVTKAQGYAIVLDTPEGRRLYAEC